MKLVVSRCLGSSLHLALMADIDCATVSAIPPKTYRIISRQHGSSKPLRISELLAEGKGRGILTAFVTIVVRTVVQIIVSLLSQSQTYIKG